MNVEQLNNDFAVDGHLVFVQGKGGFSFARIKNGLGEALISTYAGQLLSYRPIGEPNDVLFVSDAALYQSGKAIRGGIPVCWPWFGPDPDDKGRPAHGFVRNRQWHVLGSAALADGRTHLSLGLQSDGETLGMWPHEFALKIEFRVGRTLEVELLARNRGNDNIVVNQALHTYFHVGNIAATQVRGLDGKTFIDKVDGDREKTQSGAVEIAGEVDRVYTGVGGDLLIDDADLRRRIVIQAKGSRSAVVWNPWMGKAAAMSDFGDDEYATMLCVETSNAGPDAVMLAPGEEHCLMARYSIERD